jgi:hypothetical protein
MDNYEECFGDTMENTQNHCMEKCLLGQWQQEDGTQKNYKRCSSCYAGIP